MHVIHKNPRAKQDPMMHLQQAVLTMVRGEEADLTTRQLATLLTIYLDHGPHTIRDLAARLDVCKPAVCRAVDRLAELDLARRKVDPTDRRSVFVLPTPAGWAFLDALQAAAAGAEPSGRAPSAVTPTVSAAERAERRWARDARQAGDGTPPRSVSAASACSVTPLRERAAGGPARRPRPDDAPPVGGAAAGDPPAPARAAPYRRPVHA